MFTLDFRALVILGSVLGPIPHSIADLHHSSLQDDTQIALCIASRGKSDIGHRNDCTKYLPSLNSNFQLTFYHPILLLNTRSVILIALLDNPYLHICVKIEDIIITRHIR